MRKRTIGTALCLLFLLTACGTAQESVSEELTVITDPAPTGAETTAETAISIETASETASRTDAPTETETASETEPETTPEPETTAAPEPTGDQPPQLLLRDNVLRVEPGDTRDLEAVLSYGDDFDPAPTMTWTGAYDPNEPGTYPITVTLTDSAGNSADYDVIVDVPWEKMSATVEFGVFQQTGQSCGIDVSKWQGNIDFDAVRDAGAEFVLMRIGYGDTGGVMDEYFTQNFANSKAAGLERGVYFYSTAATPDAARRQADWIADALGGETLDLPVAYDWENFGHFQDWHMSFSELNAIYAAFSEQMASYGYDTMLYAEPQTLGTAWTTQDKTIWLADYGMETDYTGDYYLRQACNTGRISGIAGDVDVNIRNG